MQNLREIAHLIENQWPAKRVLVVGDVMLDQYIWGDVARISPEAPVPVVRVRRKSGQPGGAANVAVNLARLGAHADVVGFIGNDHAGQQLSQALTLHGASPQLITVDRFPTTAKLRIVGGRQQMLRLDEELAAERPPECYAQLLDSATRLLRSSHALILSDYAKGTLTPGLCQKLIAAARQLRIPVLVDPKCDDFARYRGATAVCPNLNELRLAARAPAADLEELFIIGEGLAQNHQIQYLITTLSEKGIALLQPGRRFLAPAVARQVFDVSGAGDTVIAVLALGLACDLHPESAVELANLAAGIVVSKTGTAPVEKFELIAALNPQFALHSEEKLLDRGQLAARVAQWKANGERIVLTNGCFDLLHIGHIALLEQARRFGDRLIVAINNDDSVRSLKGPSRPIVPERERARMLAALAAVDAVVLFSEETPLNTILALRPHVLVKGGDYSTHTIIGAAEVETWGGEVRIVPTVPGCSTSNLIARSATRLPAGHLPGATCSQDCPSPASR